MKRLLLTALVSTLISVSPGSAAPITRAQAPADGTYQLIPYRQNWSSAGLITMNDSWSGAPGVFGYRGDNLTTATGAAPQTLLAADVPGIIDVNANQSDPNTFTAGGVAEFNLADPVVALQGSGAANAPYLLFHMPKKIPSRRSRAPGTPI